MSTLRETLIKPLPAADSPELQNLLCHAANFTVQQLTGSYSYISDSTLDSHNATLELLTLLQNTIYGYDQTVLEQEALDRFLDYEEGTWLLSETAAPNFTGENNASPELWSYFDLSDED